MNKAFAGISRDEIAAFCKKWHVRELSLFGSVLRDDFRPDSDVDVLVSLQEESGLGVWDLTEMSDELEALFGRKVDLTIKEGLRNPYRRHSILANREVIYAS